MADYNPCVTCGACCSYYRATFYWGECDDGYGKVPAELTIQVTPHRRAMIGTDNNKPRCIALEGEIGNCVKCTIYEVRSSVCRDFPFSWENGEPNERCDQARKAHGLEPLKPFEPQRVA